MSAPASPTLSTAYSQARRLSSGALCGICKEILKANQPTLRCIDCGQSTHMAYQHKMIKDAGNEALKNEIEWLSDFIKFSALAH